jgi:hypothetical protein
MEWKIILKQTQAAGHCKLTMVILENIFRLKMLVEILECTFQAFRNTDVMLLVQSSLVAPLLDIKAQHHFHKETRQVFVVKPMALGFTLTTPKT